MFVCLITTNTMQIIIKISELKKKLSSYRANNHTIGFVPTMGALHNGHLSLIQESVSKNNITVVSIFVNPTQFNNGEDLKKYPRNLDEDIKKIKSKFKDIIIFAPTVEEMYPQKTEAKNYSFKGLENQMEGKHRPGHFNGVGTIVQHLFEIIGPNFAYFGLKDFQQVRIVETLVKKEKLKVKIVRCKIFREKNGLAMSSRNERLSAITREKASVIYNTLKKAKALFKTKSAKFVANYVEDVFKNNAIFSLEYFEIADEKTLNPCIKKSTKKKYRAFIAVFADNVRLIDNISMK